jgi:hypothetical protein
MMRCRPAWGANVQVVVSGLTGTYSSYVTTWEEYQVQRYEGASTIFGPHTLDAYTQVQGGPAAPVLGASIGGKGGSGLLCSSPTVRLCTPTCLSLR